MNSEKKIEKEKKILDAAFTLYSKKKIENVTMEDVAAAAKIGVATVYRHYKTKLELAASVCSCKWNLYFASKMSERTPEYLKDINAIDRLDFTFDLYLDLYKNHKDLLKVNDDFNHFYHESKNARIIPEYADSFGMLTNRFHDMYERAQTDGTMRTDIPEDELQRVLLHTMMGAINHYLGGFSWGGSKSEDYTEELLMLKDILMDYAKGDRQDKKEN